MVKWLCWSGCGGVAVVEWLWWSGCGGVAVLEWLCWSGCVAEWLCGNQPEKKRFIWSGVCLAC